eukprot:scaffold13207_cov143-Cylindrotheca_fusiformis.AAC.17
MSSVAFFQMPDNRYLSKIACSSEGGQSVSTDDMWNPCKKIFMAHNLSFAQPMWECYQPHCHRILHSCQSSCQGKPGRSGHPTTIFVHTVL